MAERIFTLIPATSSLMEYFSLIIMIASVFAVFYFMIQIARGKD